MREMEITIDKDGNVSIDTKGFEGVDCMNETHKLEKELGIVSSRKKKPEFYARIKKAVTRRISR